MTKLKTLLMKRPIDEIISNRLLQLQDYYQHEFNIIMNSIIDDKNYYNVMKRWNKDPETREIFHVHIVNLIETYGMNKVMVIYSQFFAIKKVG